jgi:hypothetical protein
MSIDQAGMAPGHKATATSESRSSKGSAAGGNDAVDTSDGGFSTLLSAMAAPIEPLVTEGGLSIVAAGEEKKFEDGNPLRGLELPVDPPAALNPIDSKPVLVPLAGQFVLVESDVLTSVDPALSGVDRFSKGLTVVSDDPRATEAGQLRGVSVELIPTEGVDVPLLDGLRVDPMAQKVAHARRALGIDLQIEVANTRLESKAVKAVAEFEGALNDAIKTKLSSVGEMAMRFLEPAERPRGKVFGGAASSGAEGGWAQYAQQARTVGDISSNLVFSATAPAQMQVADKVSYWVTQGVQNAQLKLDGFGDEPVEVSIVLKGGEAHVGFRSDQPEVRQMLEGALGQLKDSLQREGVVLSGVTVGGSGTGPDGGRQQERQKDPGANPRGGAVQLMSETRVQRASSTVGRSLDIFV